MTTLRDGAGAPMSPFPLLPLRSGNLLPGTTQTLPIGRERSVALVRTLKKGDVIGVALQKDPTVADPAEGDLRSVGAFARVVDVMRTPAGDYKVTLENLDRLAIGAVVRVDPFWLAEGTRAEETGGGSDDAKLLARAVQAEARALAANGAIAEPNPADAEPGVIADRVAAALGLSEEKALRVLDSLDVTERLRLVAGFLMEVKARSGVKNDTGASDREATLRDQVRAIRRELGDDGGAGAADVAALRERLDKAGLPEEARTVVARELKRLEGINAMSPEHNVIRTYLEWIADLPWSARAEAKDDIAAVAKRLDEDHFGLDDVKKRILEHMAVLRLKGDVRGSILCLAGPPGVGKTSLGQSIADATGRPFVRIALGGVRDEAEIRGHRRTYVGALPGRILNALKKAKVKNPVVLLDEIDKLGVGFQGSPESALLEVLDPEQNKTFQDHYLEIPFDLSEVLFLCTANDLGNLSAPLRDRLEIIEISGYTPEEKAHIARRHLVPKQLKAHAIPAEALTLDDEALRAIVSDYTREAGVRQLEREVKKLCRAIALEVARAGGVATSIRITGAEVAKHLGKPKFQSDVAERTELPGVATGLAWTPVGGDILFIETTRMRGKGRVEITGQLGDVMKESVKAALSYVRTHADALGVDVAQLDEEDLHVHVPAGAVPKDGPSAGVTMFTALTSLLTGIRVRPDTAMTGECTLRGKVLPVGGIKSKVLAAHRAGIKRVVLPQKNARDVDEVPKEVRDQLEFVFADDMREVLAAALEELPRPRVKGPVFGSSIPAAA